MQYLDAISKMTEWSLFIFKANHSISLESKSMAQPLLPNKLNSSMKTFYEGLVRPSRTSIKPSTRRRTSTRPSRTNTQKRCPFHYRGLECKSRKSRNTWSNRQIWPWSTEWSRAKTNRVLPREHTGHSKHTLPTIQEKALHMDITRWSTLKSDWLYSLLPNMEKLYTGGKYKNGSWLWLRSWTP